MRAVYQLAIILFKQAQKTTQTLTQRTIKGPFATMLKLAQAVALYALLKM